MNPIDPKLRIRSVTLAVGDLERSTTFYKRVLGLPLLARDAGGARLGFSESAPALVLEQLAAPRALIPHATGLYHVAWLHPSHATLAETVRRVAGARWPIEGASDHGVSAAVYLSDPDGLGIEIYADRPRELWRRTADGRGVRMSTMPLDMEELLAQSPGAPPAQMAQGTGVGHVHLKVSDVPRANAFYRDALGFEEQAHLPSAAFLGAGGYHHHVGLNSWQSAGAQPAPEGSPELARLEFELSGRAALEELAARIGSAGVQAERADDGEELEVRDPDGSRLVFV